MYFIKRSETKEKKRVRQKSMFETCERVEKVLRRVTHAQGVRLGRFSAFFLKTGMTKRSILSRGAIG